LVCGKNNKNVEYCWQFAISRHSDISEACCNQLQGCSDATALAALTKHVKGIATADLVMAVLGVLACWCLWAALKDEDEHALFYNGCFLVLSLADAGLSIAISVTLTNGDGVGLLKTVYGNQCFDRDAEREQMHPAYELFKTYTATTIIAQCVIAFGCAVIHANNMYQPSIGETSQAVKVSRARWTAGAEISELVATAVGFAQFSDATSTFNKLYLAMGSPTGGSTACVHSCCVFDNSTLAGTIISLGHSLHASSIITSGICILLCSYWVLHLRK
jgi:hypothetical protein